MLGPRRVGARRRDVRVGPPQSVDGRGRVIRPVGGGCLGVDGHRGRTIQTNYSLLPLSLYTLQSRYVVESKDDEDDLCGK